jgi:type II secretory pathway pseudopilin PulG
MKQLRARLAAVGDDGIGLIEIVISMFLIALIAISFLPLLLHTLTASTTNTSTSAASQLVQSSMDQARVVSPTCSAATSFVAATIASVPDARGVVLQPQRQMIGSCPTAYPGTVTVRAWVTESGKSFVLAESTTLIYVSSAS